MKQPPPLWRWRPFLSWIVIALMTGIFGAMLPLLESIGYEFALLTSLVCSLGAGQLSAHYPRRARAMITLKLSPRLPIVDLYGRATGLGLVVVAIPLAVALLNGLRIPFCNLTDGLAFYLLMPVCAVFIASAIGLVLGLVTTRGRFASLLFFLLYLLGILGAVFSFHNTPAVFIFNPFFGYFPGVLYDRLVQVDIRLVTYRFATALQVLAIVSVAHLLFDPSEIRLTLARVRLTPRRTLFPACALAAALVMQSLGPALGHRTDREHLERHLSTHVATDHLDIFFPDGTRKEIVDALSRDAEFSLSRVERYLNTRYARRIAVFFFADAADKGAVIGAAQTNVAKPWRGEVYVVLDSVPHWVVRHELVHAVTGPMGSPPFAVSSRAWGLIPNPGLVEGIAMAAGGPRGELTLHQWSAAMLAAGILPPVETLFSLKFFSLSASRAYTAAGSFCAWVRETYGPEVLKAAYRAADFEGVTKKTNAQLAAAWKAFLTRVPTNERDIAVAEYRFDRPSVIGTTCVHEVEKLCSRARTLSASGAHDEALALFETAHARSNQATMTQRELFYARVNAGDSADLRKMAGNLMKDPGTGKVDRHAIREILVDFDIAADQGEGRFEGEYRQLANEAKSDSDRRRLEVKAHLARHRQSIPLRLFSILALRPERNDTTPILAALTIADAWASNPEDPVLAYLHARQYFNVRDYPSALSLLTHIDMSALSDEAPSLRFAARMMIGESLLHVGRFHEARFAFTAVARDPSSRPGQRAIAEDWVARVDFEAFR